MFIMESEGNPLADTISSFFSPEINSTYRTLQSNLQIGMVKIVADHWGISMQYELCLLTGKLHLISLLFPANKCSNTCNL